MEIDRSCLVATNSYFSKRIWESFEGERNSKWYLSAKVRKPGFHVIFGNAIVTNFRKLTKHHLWNRFFKLNVELVGLIEPHTFFLWFFPNVSNCKHLQLNTSEYSAIESVLYTKALLKNSQNSRENTCIGVSL